MPARFDDTTLDHLIARQLPVWMTRAQPEQLRALKTALVAQQRTQARLGHALQGITPLDTFAASLLEAALHQATGRSLDVRKAQVDLVTYVPIPSGLVSVPPRFERYVVRHSLLTAALHNFEAVETREEGFSNQSQLLDDTGQRLALTPQGFARLCRELDIGARYQAHLRAHLSPAGEAGQALARDFEQGYRERMAVAVHLARAQGTLGDDTYRRLLRVVTPMALVPADDTTLRHCQLRLLGHVIHGVVISEVSAGDRAQGVISWIPGDPYGELAWHASCSALYAALAGRLATPGYAGFFQGLIAERDRAGFCTTLARRLKGQHANVPIELDGRNEPLAEDLFSHLRADEVARRLDDARVLAVPTGDEDRQARHRRLAFYREAALDLLGLATFFVPGLGGPLLLASAAQLASEVYAGYEQWQLGDREAALEHLFAVGETLVQSAVLAGAGALIPQVAKRLAFVEGLTPQLGEGGHLKLAVVDSAHQQAAPAALLGQLDVELAGLDDEAAGQLLSSVGMDTDHVRQLHLERAPAPAALRDAGERLRLHRAVPELRGEAFEARIALNQAPSDRDAQVLLRDFPGLTQRTAREIVEQASDAQRSDLAERGKVPLALAEQARWALRDARLNRACAGLYLPRSAGADTERLVFGLIARLAPWPEGVRIELRQARPTGEVLAETGAADAGQVRLIVKRNGFYHAVDGQGVRLAGAQADDELLQAVWLQLDSSQRATLGQPSQLAQVLVQEAQAHREAVAGILGLAPVGGGVRPPVRLGDGRLGYPLSGRGATPQAALRRGIRQVFPTLTDTELDTYVAELRRQHLNPWLHLQQLAQQRLDLQEALEAWHNQLHPVRTMLSRRRVAQSIRRCWRRKLGRVGDGYRLQLDGERIVGLPSLPAQVRFEHVTQLHLRNMALQDIEGGFLQRFPNLRVLDLSDNQLSAIPAHLERLERLEHLLLGGNRIVLDEAGNSRLQALTRLRQLDLSDNALGRAPDVQGLPRLREINLRNTGLLGLPPQVLSHPLLEEVDLRENRLQRLRPEEWLTTPQRLQRLALHDNPLDAASQQQLDNARAAAPVASGSARPAQERSTQDAHAEVDADTLEQWLDSSAPTRRALRAQQWQRLREEPQARYLLRFFADLAKSREFRRQPQALRARVWHIIERCLENSQMREGILLEAARGRTCQDQLLLILSDLEVRVLVVEMTEGLSGAFAERGLLRLGRSLYRLDAVNRIAARHVELEMSRHGLVGVDEVEVFLAYRVGLGETLGLPAAPGHMYFQHASGVNQLHLNAARGTVLQGESSAALAESLLGREFWVEHLRERYAGQLELTNQPFYERLEALETLAEGLATGLDLTQVEQVAREQRAAERTLLLSLTEQALARHRL